MVLKPNRRGRRAVEPGCALRVAARLDQRGPSVFMTLSEEGARREGGATPPAGPTRPPLDPVGAGDSFIAALAASSAGAVLSRRMYPGSRHR